MSRRLAADLALVFCALIWGGTFVVVQGALADASVFVFLALRFCLAAAIMAIAYRGDVRRLTREEFRAGALLGLFMFGGYVCQTVGLLYTTPSKAAFITGFGVVLVPVLLAAFWQRRTSAWLWGGALVSLAGLYYLTVPQRGISELNRGDLLVLICAVLFAFQIIFIGRYSQRHSVGGLSFLQIGTTAVLSLVFVPILAITGGEPARIHLTSRLAAAVVVTGVLATALAFSTQLWAQRHTTPTHTAIVLALEPVFAAVTSYIVIHEHLGGRVLAGAVLILVGIVLAEWKGPIQAAPDSPGTARQVPDRR